MTDASDLSKHDHDMYDCEIVLRPTAPIPTTHASVLGSSTPEAGLRPLGVTYPTIRALNDAIKKAGGHALAVPIAYRAAPLSEEAAARIATAFLDKLAANTGHRLGALVHGGGSAHCWHFSADDPDAQSLGVEPGIVSVRIDRLDGHVWTAQECVEFARMQGWDDD
jgi:hypothetical protein